jgi:protein SCO1/2
MTPMPVSSHAGLGLRSKAVLQAGVILFSLAGRALASQNGAPGKNAAGNIGIEQHLGNQVPLDLKFQNEAGQTVTLGSNFDNRPVILSLVYYGCRMMCTLTEYGLVNALKEIPGSIGDQYSVVTVSFDAREKPELAALNKKTYTELYGRPGAQKGWHFLVGSEPSIHALTEAVGWHYQYLADIDLFSHPTGIMVLTPSGRISNYFYGIEFRAQDLRMALEDAAREKIATPETIKARLQNGVAGGGSVPAANDSAKPKCAPGTVSPSERKQ